MVRKDDQGPPAEWIGGLSAAERRVAEYLWKHPGMIVLSTAGELGELSGTSDATVIRTPRGDGLVVGHATPSGSAWPGAPAALCEVPPR